MEQEIQTEKGKNNTSKKSVCQSLQCEPRHLGSELDKDYFKARTDSDSHFTRITMTSSAETGLGIRGRKKEKKPNKIKCKILKT